MKILKENPWMDVNSKFNQLLFVSMFLLGFFYLARGTVLLSGMDSLVLTDSWHLSFMAFVLLSLVAARNKRYPIKKYLITKIYVLSLIAIALLILFIGLRGA